MIKIGHKQYFTSPNWNRAYHEAILRSAKQILGSLGNFGFAPYPPGTLCRQKLSILTPQFVSRISKETP